MRKMIKFTLASLPIFVAQVMAGQSYTKEEAIKVALEKSSDVQTAEQELVSARSQVDQAYGNAYPSIDLNATSTRIFGLDDVNPNAKNLQNAMNGMAQNPAFGAPSAYDMALATSVDKMINGMAAQGYRWQSSIGLTATQILYAQGKISTGTQIAKAYSRVKEVNLENTKSNVRYSVVTSFDQLIYLDSAIVILKESIEQVKSHLDYVDAAVKSGLATELNQVRAQISLDELKSTLENTEKSRILARNALLNTMGLGWEADVEFKGELIDPTSGKAPFPDTSVANASNRRKEMTMLKASEDMLKKNIDIERGDYKPTVVLGGKLTYSNNQNEFYKWDAPDWDENISKVIFLNVSMNLFNGMQTREKVSQAKSNLRSTQIQRETLERGIRLQIESAANTLANAEAQLTLKKRRVELETKNLEMTETAYKAGRETQLNYLDATMSLKNAKLDYLNAVVAWNNAYNELLKATGEF